MNLKPFTGPGSTPSRRRFWDQVTQAVIASQKLAGRFVTVDEHPGKGTVVNVADSSTRRGGGGGGVGACCYNDGTCDDLTESDCNDAGGNWQGTGTTCADDPNPCRGACCEGEGGTTCVEDSTPDSCAADGGTFQDFGSTCDPDPCGGGNCCSCGLQTPFEDPDNPGNFYTTATNHCDGSMTYSGPTTEDTLYSHYEEHFTCCDPATGHLDIIQDDFCDLGIEPPGCDNTFDCDPFDCILSCVGGSSFEGSQTISNPVTGPSCITSPLSCECTGACCINGECSILTAADCVTASGYYFGDGSPCFPDPCADLGCCITPGDPFTLCNTILGADCSGTFGGPGTFCWPEGEESFELNSCCNNGQITCSGGELGFHFCCDPGQTCCGDIGCCEEGQTCDEIFGCM